MFPLYPFCWDFLNCKSILNFVKIFSRIYWVVYMVCILQFVKVVYYIDWFVDIESSLHTWGKSHVIMMHDPFTIWLNCLYFGLFIFYWGFSHLCSSVILACNFHFCVLSLSDWCWPCRMSWEAFLPLQFFGIFWKGWMLILF